MSATQRDIEGLAETSLTKLSQNSAIVAREYDQFLQKIQHNVDELAERCMAAARYQAQQAEIQCKTSTGVEQQLSAIIAQCHDLQNDFRALQEVSTKVTTLQSRLAIVERALGQAS